MVLLISKHRWSCANKHTAILLRLKDLEIQSSSSDEGEEDEDEPPAALRPLRRGGVDPERLFHLGLFAARPVGLCACLSLSLSLSLSLPLPLSLIPVID